MWLVNAASRCWSPPGSCPESTSTSFWGALLSRSIVAAAERGRPALLAALRLPLTLVFGFLLVLIADALILLLAADVTDGVLRVDNFGWALLAALVVAAVERGARRSSSV